MIMVHKSRIERLGRAYGKDIVSLGCVGVAEG